MSSSEEVEVPEDCAIGLTLRDITDQYIPIAVQCSTYNRNYMIYIYYIYNTIYIYIHRIWYIYICISYISWKPMSPRRSRPGPWHGRRGHRIARGAQVFVGVGRWSFQTYIMVFLQNWECLGLWGPQFYSVLWCFLIVYVCLYFFFLNFFSISSVLLVLLALLFVVYSIWFCKVFLKKKTSNGWR